jgi:transposase InsO family protein
MSEDERIVYKPLVLKGSENYEGWKLSISSVLLSKDLLDFIYAPPTDAKDKRKAGKCFDLIIQSLSPVITSPFPAECRNPLDPKATLLWTHLERTFSANVGARQAILVQDLFLTSIPEGEDPMPHLSKLPLAHAQLNSGGENLSDKMLAYAMTIALPESWSTQKQSLWLQESLNPESVASAVRAEWQRRVRESGGGETALAAQQQQGRRPQQAGIEFPRDPTAFCDFHGVKGHSTENCLTRKRAEANKAKNKPQAKVAQTETVPTTQIANLDVSYDSDASVFISAALPNISQPVPGIFIIDSGASHHMVTSSALLLDVKQTTPTSVKIGDGTSLLSHSSGSLILGPVKLTNVLVVPGLKANLLSVSQTPSPFDWRFSRYSATLYNADNSPVFTAHLQGGLYTLKASSATALSAAAADRLSALHVWHHRLGHLNVRAIMQLYRAGRIDGLDAITSQDVSKFKCEACIMGKGTRLPAPPAEDIQATKPGELVHVNLWGPATTPSIGGACYFLTCYDDYSRKVHLSFLKQKSEAFSAIKRYIALVERQLTTQVKTLRSDNDGEFASKEWDNYMRQFGIQHIRVPPGAHAQNGRVERVHLPILNLVRTYLAGTGLPQSFWTEGASYAAYTRNRTPCGPQSAIPDDKWFGKTKRHDHLQPFGSPYTTHHRKEATFQPTKSSICASPFMASSSHLAPSTRRSTSGSNPKVLNPSKPDPCLYSRRGGDESLMLSVHVDDQLMGLQQSSRIGQLQVGSQCQIRVLRLWSSRLLSRFQHSP